MTESNATKGRAIIYCRAWPASPGVETPERETAERSLDEQEAACVAYAEELGYEIGRITRDISSGATMADRVLLGCDFEDLRFGHFRALIAATPGRLSPLPPLLAILRRYARGVGVELIFVSEASR